MQGEALFPRIVPGSPVPARRQGLARRALRTAIPSAAILAALAVLAAVTGCSGQGTVKLPPKSSSPQAPAPAASAPGSAKAAVTAAYTAYFPALKAAEAAPPARAEAVLAPYAAQPYLGKILAQMASYRAQDEVASGYVTPHVTKATVSGRLAEVYDCQDASHATLTNTRTGKVTPPLKGSARTHLIASLTLGGDGRWRLTSLAHVAVPCQPVPSPSP